MADGRIQNRNLLAKAARDLNVEGVKQAPAHLNLEQVLMTYQLGGGLTGPRPCSLAKTNGPFGEAVPGLGAYSVPIIGAAYVNPLFGATLGMDATIAAMSIRVIYTGGGAIADAGAVLGLQIARTQKYGSLDQSLCVKMSQWQNVAAAELEYCFNLGTYVFNGTGAGVPTAHVNGEIGSRVIPEGDNMEVYVYRGAGVWPADTIMKVEVLVFTDICQPQVAWAPLS